MVNSAVLVFTPRSTTHRSWKSTSRLGRRRMGLRHAPHLQRPARLGEDLRAALADMITHRRIRQARRAVLVDQPRQNPSRGVPLLLRRIQIRLRSIASIAALNGSSRGATRCGVLRGGGTADSNAWRTVRRCTPMLVRQRPNRQPLHPMITANRRKLLHPRPHPPALTFVISDPGHPDR